MKDGKADVATDLKAIDWKLSAAALQKLLAASGKPDGTPEEKNKAALRRLWVGRAFFTYQIAKQQTTTVNLRFRIEGVRMGEAELKVALAEDAISPIVTDMVGKPVPGDYGSLVGVALEEPIQALRAAVADHPGIDGVRILDGVRIDPGFTFGPAGELIVAGLQPGLAAAGQKELQTVVQTGLVAMGQGKPLAPTYARIARQPVTVKAMTVLPLGKVKADLRAWVIAAKDDLKLLRVYFPDSLDSLKKRYYVDEGGLVLLYRPAKAADIKDVEAEFRRVLKVHLENGVPPPPAAAPAPTGHADAEKEPLLPSLTAYLRREMAADQKKWNGVLIERGYFDLEKKNRYTLLGVVDAARQNVELQKLLDTLKADPKWVEYFTPEEPAKVALDVIPMRAMLDRVKRVTPAYAVFDGMRIESAHYDANVNLIFDAHIVGLLDPAAPPMLAKLLRDSAAYRRRAPADKQVVIARLDGPAYPDDQLANFSLAFGAKLLAKANASKEDDERAKTWLGVGMLHYPNESAVWFLSAYYNFTIARDDELTRRDLYRVVDLEGPLAFNGPAQRRRRYETAKDLQGKDRIKLEALWLDCFREVKDGAQPITMTKK